MPEGVVSSVPFYFDIAHLRRCKLWLRQNACIAVLTQNAMLPFTITCRTNCTGWLLARDTAEIRSPDRSTFGKPIDVLACSNYGAVMEQQDRGPLKGCLCAVKTTSLTFAPAVQPPQQRQNNIHVMMHRCFEHQIIVAQVCRFSCSAACTQPSFCLGKGHVHVF